MGPGVLHMTGRGQDVSEGASLGGIVFTAEHVFQGPPSRPTVRVAKPKIQSMRLRFGCPAPSPVGAVLVGLFLIGLGLLPLVHLAYWFVYGGTFHAAEAFLLVWLPFGVAALLPVFRTSFLLDVQTPAGTRTLEFEGGLSGPEVEHFIREAERLYGYAVEVGPLH